MSFNSHLAFNIKKATPTTSTTNTNTTSLSAAPSNERAHSKSNNGDGGASKSQIGADIGTSSPKLPMPHLASKSTPTTSEPNTPKFNSVGKSTTLSNTIPAVALDESSNMKTKKDSIGKDLIGLFDKFDIDNNKSANKSEPEESDDPVTEKYKEFAKQAKKEDPKEDDIFASKEKKASETNEFKESNDDQVTEKVVESEISEKPTPSSMTIQPYIIPNTNMAATSKIENTGLSSPIKSLSSEHESEFDEKKEEKDKSLDDITGNEEEQSAPVEEYELKTANDKTNLSQSPDSEPTSIPIRPPRHRNNSIRETQVHVNPEEQYLQSHKPFDFQNFLNHLKKKSADPILGNKKADLSFMEYAITELNKIDKYRAPRDKIICILNSCKIIFSFLKANSKETNADAFMPLLILIIIKSRTPNIISNIHYIESYRGEEWLNHGETSYYLSSLQGAVGFIQSISFDKLTISKEAYDAHIEAWEAQKKTFEISQPTKLVQPQPHHLNENNGPQHSLSPSNVLFTSAEMFTKSLSNFLSPSPQNESPLADQQREQQEQTQNSIREEEERIKRESDKTYSQLKEMFPALDKSILKDVVTMNKGALEESLDSCLQLVNEI
ncbi:hypothetical protein QCA50_017548 [Cerrena zonata]|uniref:Uncharacterized protein n=1 Tax=Cerrena zonata TaxID=2478898 RepID=A0AAW0FPW0_9APHY